MIRKDNQTPPKLKAKGGEVRYLVPFSLQLAIDLQQAADSEVHKAMVKLFSALNDFYMAISTAPFDSQAAGRSTRT
eukprot:10402205-Lingulodinium_polyedra.AAC.1